MVPEKLLRLEAVIVEVPEAGSTSMVWDVGLADTVKSDTLMVMVVE